MNIPFAELRRCYFAYREEFDDAYQNVMRNGHYIMGPQLESFEEEFSKFCGTKFALGVGNGLDALILTLRALDIGAGDEVIVSAHTFIASWLAISECKATVVPAPLTKDGFLMDVRAVEKLISPRTKAIMPVHLYGEAVDMTHLMHLSNQYHISIIEDAAQAHGAKHKGRLCGSFGAAAGFSFYPGKNLGAFGDAGAITTNDETLFNKLKYLRNYGSKKKYVHETVGYNSRLDELQAAFLRVKLRHLEEWNKIRQEKARHYNSSFKNIDYLRTPTITEGDECVWHQYVVVTPHRDALQAYLKDLGIETLIHYPIANHRQGAYAPHDFSRYNLIPYEKLVDSVLSLPIDAFMTESETQAVIDAICRFNP